jgi:hypothetical protein
MDNSSSLLCSALLCFLSRIQYRNALTQAL